jgi:hypothetical protein
MKHYKDAVLFYERAVGIYKTCGAIKSPGASLAVRRLAQERRDHQDVPAQAKLR